MLSEKQIQTQILEYLRACGYLIERFNMGGIIYGNKMVMNKRLRGFPDLFGVLKNEKRKGVLFLIEVKKDGEKLKESQEAWKEEFKRRGCPHITARTLAQAINGINAAEKGEI